MRAEVGSGEDCAASAMSRFDWDDRAGREVLVDSRAEDARGALAALGDGECDGEVVVAGELSARVVGGDVDVGDDGVLRVAWWVVPDRVMWTVGGGVAAGRRSLLEVSTVARVVSGSTLRARSSPSRS